MHLNAKSMAGTRHMQRKNWLLRLNLRLTDVPTELFKQIFAKKN